ncbi:MAG TPA: adenylyl-sulfate kinase, partial [Chondromyces sp.]|nr:adenylyl-sulfate kinase [Chondromyces sp.]
QLFSEGEFIEVYIDCPLEICESRDPKGLYKKARKGEIKDFTGIDSPYEAPENPDITLKTSEMSVKEAAQKVLDYLMEKKYI